MMHGLANFKFAGYVGDKQTRWYPGPQARQHVYIYPSIGLLPFYVTSLLLLLLLLEALQLQRSLGLLEFLPLGPLSDAVNPVCYFHPCYIARYIILPSIFRSS